MGHLSKTNVTVGIGIVLIVIGYGAVSTTAVTTLRMCGTSTGYHINSVTLTTVAYYDGCNWVTASSGALAAPIGGAVLAVGVISKLYQDISELLRT